MLLAVAAFDLMPFSIFSFPKGADQYDTISLQVV